MTQLLEFRKKVVEIYQKIDYIVMPVLKFFLALCGFIAIKNVVGFNAKYSSMIIVLALSVVSAFLPSTVVVAIMVLYIALQLYNVSLFMAGTVLVLAVIIFCFFIRYISKYSAGIIGMPVLMGMNIPYTLPITFGLFSTPITIVPTCVGVFAYYFLKGVKDNITTLEQVSQSKEPYVLFTNVLTNVLKNEAMFATMIVFAIIIVVVYCVRNIKMDYSFEIATGVGAATSMLGFIILMLKYDFGSSILGVILSSIISGGISLVVYLIYRPLRYAATESVQFEDDDYYYYVKAIPKIKITGNKVNERQIINRRKEDDDDIDDEEFEDLESRIMDTSEDEIGGFSRTNRDNLDDELDEDIKIAAPRQANRPNASQPVRPNAQANKPQIPGIDPAAVKVGRPPVAGQVARPVVNRQSASNPAANRPTANQAVNKTAGQPVNRQVINPATNRPAAQTNGQPVNRPAGQPVSRPAGQTGQGPVNRAIASQQANRPAAGARPVNRPVNASQPVNKPASNGPVKPVDDQATKRNV